MLEKWRIKDSMRPKLFTFSSHSERKRKDANASIFKKKKNPLFPKCTLHFPLRAGNTFGSIELSRRNVLSLQIDIASIVVQNQFSLFRCPKKIFFKCVRETRSREKIFSSSVRETYFSQCYYYKMNYEKFYSGVCFAVME